MSICYIAGPMRGMEDYNFPAFFAAEERLREWGWEVHNPARIDIDSGHDPMKDGEQPFKRYMERDLPAVCRSDALFVLPGWENSHGANLEVHVATECDIPVFEYDPDVPIPYNMVGGPGAVILVDG